MFGGVWGGEGSLKWLLWLNFKYILFKKVKEKTFLKQNKKCRFGTRRTRRAQALAKAIGSLTLKMYLCQSVNLSSENKVSIFFQIAFQWHPFTTKCPQSVTIFQILGKHKPLLRPDRLLDCYHNLIICSFYHLGPLHKIPLQFIIDILVNAANRQKDKQTNTTVNIICLFKSKSLSNKTCLPITNLPLFQLYSNIYWNYMGDKMLNHLETYHIFVFFIKQTCKLN